MQTLSSLNQIAAALADTPHAQVVIIYEKFSAGLKAKQFFDRHVVLAEPARRPRFQMWGFAGLRIESVRRQALRDALESDVVCLALLSDAKLPDSLQIWTESWAQQRGTHRCLLLLLLESRSDNPASRSPLIHFLREAAARANAEFLTTQLDPFGTEQNLPILESTNHL